MNRVVRLTAVAVGAAGLLMSTTAATSAAPSAASAAPAAVSTTVAATTDSAKFKPRERFTRELVKEGDADTGVYDIDHVRELQYRLKWAGVYDGSVDGRFDSAVTRAVKRFQKRNDLRTSGTANSATWAELIPQTVRARTAIPDRCKSRRNVQWHACYDRARHQVTLWHKGVLRNSWLVRGGSYSNQTRVGTNTVFSRDKDHVSGIFGSPMPYSQFFDGGQALHGSSTMIDPFVGHSHGCVNMYNEDARQLWKLTTRHPMSQMKVTVYGAWS
jgi:peptidoglycan hydrolase-like protein with peptidoglycan-binding domain